MSTEIITAIGIGITATASIICANAFVVKLVVKNAVNDSVIHTLKDIKEAVEKHEETCPAMKHFMKSKT